jgi:competence protein ComFC
MPVPLRPAYRMYRWLWSGLDCLYPPACGGCGTQGVRWCSSCHGETVIIGPHVCPVCGQAGVRTGLCSTCQASPPQYTRLRSWAEYAGPLRHALHRLKYHKDMALGEVLARPLAGCLRSLDWGIDTLLPVPLGVARFAQRGYNQSALLARPLALAMHIPYRPAGLRRPRETRSQVDLSAEQRRVNVSGAFRAEPKLVRGRRVLVVDDIATSGATLEACAAALLEAGAADVYCLTVARAGVRSHQSEPGLNRPGIVMGVKP